MTNSTVTGNVAFTAGGGIATGDDDFTITNSIVAATIEGPAPGTADIAVIWGGAGLRSTARASATLESTVCADVAIDPDRRRLAGPLANNGGPVETVLILRGGVAANTGDNATFLR